MPRLNTAPPPPAFIKELKKPAITRQQLIEYFIKENLLPRDDTITLNVNLFGNRVSTECTGEEILYVRSLMRLQGKL